MIVSQWNRSMEHGVSGQKSEEEYFDMLRSRILECICGRIISNEPTSFHSVDMIRECARGFLDQLGIDVYQFSEEHPFYQRVYDEVYRLLVEADLMVENENNTFTIPIDSGLRNICRKQLRDKSYVMWDDFWKDVESTTT
ncbi:MAG: hypothetical protein GEU26_17790 [Nitrososphaeraceae archaeon]|nr:hypothetical protein [Nitrososphaeraceae archaeon]